MVRYTIRRLSAIWVSFVSRNYWKVASAALLVTVFSAWLASDLRVDANLSALLPDDHQTVKTLKRIREKVGGVGALVVIIQSPDSAANFRFADALIPLITNSKLINSVDSNHRLAYFQDRKLLYVSTGDLKEIRRRVARKLNYEKSRQDPLFASAFLGLDPGFDVEDIESKYDEVLLRTKNISEDGQRVLVVAYPKGSEGNIGLAKKALAAVGSMVDGLDPRRFGDGISISYAGEFKNKVVRYEVIVGDIKNTGLAAIIGVTILIALFFRQLMAIVYIGLPLMMGILWTFGITSLTIGNLNLITGILIAILAGLGIDFGIHTFSRYIEGRNGGADTESALTHALQHTGVAMITSALTTATAFYALTITNFKGFSEFGFIAGTGVILSLVSIYVTFPSFVFIGERLWPIKHTAITHRNHESEPRKFPYPRIVLLCSGLVIVVAALLIPFVQFEFKWPALAAVESIKSEVAKVREMPPSPAVIVVEDASERRQVVAELVRRKMLPGSTIRSVRSIETVIPDSQDVKLRILASIRRMVGKRIGEITDGSSITQEQLEKWLDPQLVTAEELPEYALRWFQGNDGSVGEFVAVYPAIDMLDGEKAIEFAAEVRAVVTKRANYNASGSPIIFADTLMVMFEDMRIAIACALLAVVLILLLDFRRVWPLLVVLVPLIGGVVIMCGIMVISGMKFNFFNIIVLPSIIGIGVDSGVHLFHRNREEGVGSVWLVLTNTGGPVLMTTMTTMVGFAGLIFAQHTGLQSVGKLAVIGLGACLLMSLVTLPALLQYLENRRIPMSDSES